MPARPLAADLALIIDVVPLDVAVDVLLLLIEQHRASDLLQPVVHQPGHGHGGGGEGVWLAGLVHAPPAPRFAELQDGRLGAGRAAPHGREVGLTICANIQDREILGPS